MSEQTPRHFWLCADDYGIAPGVDAAIRDLIGRGRLNATSVMVVAPSFTPAEADALTNVGRVAIGLHLTLTAPFKPRTADFRPFPQVRDVVLDAARRLPPRAWVRQCVSATPFRARLGDPKGLLVDALSRAVRRRASKLGIATNPAFAGTYTYRPDADFPRLFPGFLDGLPEGGLVMCHPGHVDAELKRLDPLTTIREREYAYFCSDAFVEALEAHGLTLN